MSTIPPLPHLVGKSLLKEENEVEELPPSPEASLWRRLQYRIFYVPRGARGIKDIVLWWEKRRLFYNLLVSVLAGGTVVALEILFPPRYPLRLLGLLEAAVEFLVVVNCFYCLGAAGELALQLFIRQRRHRIARVLLNIGLTISFLLVGLPGAIATLINVWILLTS